MKRRWLRASALLTWVALVAGCASKKDTATAVATTEPSAPAAVAPVPKNEAIAAASQSLQAGKFDEAAARLLEVRVSGKELTQKEAADYREALEEAYSLALEAAQKGDPRAQATLQMIKAAIAR